MSDRNRQILTKSARNSQAGLSLIELLIALGLGIFLLASVIQVFMASRQSHEVIHAQATMQEAGRFGIYFLDQAIGGAGYANLGLGSDLLDSPNGSAAGMVNTIINKTNANHWVADVPFVQHAVVSGADNFSSSIGSVQVKAGTDVVFLRTQGDSVNNVDNAMRDCHGRVLDNTVGAYVEMTFFVGSDDQLYCDATNAGVQGAVALVSGVENMQVQYGVYSLETFSPQRYVAAGDMDADMWDDVVSLRVGLLAVSDNSPLDGGSDSYTLLDQSIAVSGDQARHARQVFDQTIPIRSKLSNP